MNAKARAQASEPPREQDETGLPVYAIAQGQVHTPKKHDAYVAAALPTGTGRWPSIDLDVQVIKGQVSHPRTLIIEFPTREHSFRLPRGCTGSGTTDIGRTRFCKSRAQLIFPPIPQAGPSKIREHHQPAL